MTVQRVSQPSASIISTPNVQIPTARINPVSTGATGNHNYVAAFNRQSFGSGNRFNNSRTSANIRSGVAIRAGSNNFPRPPNNARTQLTVLNHGAQVTCGVSKHVWNKVRVPS